MITDADFVGAPVDAPLSPPGVGPLRTVVWRDGQVEEVVGNDLATAEGHRVELVVLRATARAGGMDVYLVDTDGADEPADDPFSMEVLPSGALSIRQAGGDLVRLYAPGAWLEVSPDVPVRVADVIDLATPRSHGHL